MAKYIMALDAGTTSERAIIFDRQGNIISTCQKPLKQYYPKKAWVEHDPKELFNTQVEVAKGAMENAKITASDILAIGLTNQRETTIIWDKKTGEPIYNAIVWQCTRTAPYIQELKNSGYEKIIREKTGLVLDAYFSASKIRWILKNVPGAMEKAKNGELCFGTVDCWILYNLTGKKVFATDYTNASRTMLYNIYDLCWDQKLLDLFDIPKSMMPNVKNSSGVFGRTEKNIFGDSIVISGIAGDQQSSLFGQTCFDKNDTKVTYGTGCFILTNTGEKAVKSDNNLINTIAWGIDDKITYATEGSIFTCGTVIDWLKDGLGIIDKVSQTEKFSNMVKDNGGVYFVPAFVGLGAPHWDMYARGTIVGLTSLSNKYHIVRATMEAIAYQTRDVVNAMDVNSNIKKLYVDGGASVNNFLMQFQSDILDKTVIRPLNVETTALGAAFLSGLAVGYWKDTDDIKKNIKIDRIFNPQMTDDLRASLISKWNKAILKSKNWEE